MKRERKSALKIIEQYANDLLTRSVDPDTKVKLLVIETIAFRMGWTDLYNRVRFKPQFTPPRHWYQD